jgi:outer membrane translocation and assembly module TamA
LSHFDDSKDTFNGFSRADLELRQYVSFLGERRVLVGRAKVSTTSVESAGTVPFFLLPFLGGNDTLRGFRAYRFRGPHSILLQGEYRWEIWSAFEAALFADAGKVAMDRSDLNLKSLESDYGIGFRFNTDNGVVMRVDAAFGSKDGKHLHVVFGTLF